MPFAIFVFGLLAGSFLNALIYRLHSGDSIFARHSICPNCKHELSVLDLVPLLSFILLRGRCRYCGQKISWQYPIVELATATLFLLLAQNFQFPQPSLDSFGGQAISNFQFWFQLVFVCFLILIFVYDLKHYLILDKVVFPAAALALVYQVINNNLLSALLGALVLSGFFAILFFVSRGRWIGFGDVKLGLFLGFLAGWPIVIVTFFSAYFLGALVAVPLLISGKKSLADRLPFGTFLTLAGFIAMIWGESMLAWYLKLIGFGL